MNTNKRTYWCLSSGLFFVSISIHDDVIKWKHFPHYWPFVRGIHRSPVNSPLKGQWRGALMFFLIFVWINGWVNNREAGDLRRYRAHYDVTLMLATTPDIVTTVIIHSGRILVSFSKIAINHGPLREVIIIGSNYTPRLNEVERGLYWFHLVRLSVCGQNRVRSVSSTILIGSISYLHILSSNFRKCVACNVCFKIKKCEILANSWNL